MTDESNPISRRTFVRDGATAAAAFAMAPMIVPRHVLGGVGYRPPSRTLNVAMIGFGGMGMSNMNALLQAGENVVAVCDIDYGYVDLRDPAENRDWCEGLLEEVAALRRVGTPNALAAAQHIEEVVAENAYS
jgi:hypothetical protein